MKQTIQFCKASDGVGLAYSSVGTGPALVKAANWMNHLEQDWQSPVWRHLLHELAGHHRVIRYDERGTGLSDRNIENLSFDAFVDDLESVVDASGIDQFTLFGISQGGPVALAYASRFPERVSKLVLLGSFAAGWKRAQIPENIRQKREAQVTLIREGWQSRNPAIRQLWTTMCIPDSTADEARSFNDLQLESVSGETAARIFDSIGDFDVTDRLPSLDVPALVFHARGDALVPFEEGRSLASSIKNARFVPLESNNHLLLSHEPAWFTFVEELRSFLGVPSGASNATETRICPTCSAKYNDISLNFCLEDGTPLIDQLPADLPTRII